MGYALPSNSPSVLVNGQQHAVGAFLSSNIVGDYFIAGLFRMDGTSGWNLVSRLVLNSQKDDLLIAIKAKGGGVKFMAWLVAEINKMILELFTAPPPVDAEPTTGDEAVAYVTSRIAMMKLTLVNGVPTLT